MSYFLRDEKLLFDDINQKIIMCLLFVASKTFFMPTNWRKGLWYGYYGLGCVGHNVGHPNINEKLYQLHFDRVQGMLIIFSMLGLKWTFLLRFKIWFLGLSFFRVKILEGLFLWLRFRVWFLRLGQGFKSLILRLIFHIELRIKVS